MAHTTGWQEDPDPSASLGAPRRVRSWALVVVGVAVVVGLTACSSTTPKSAVGPASPTTGAHADRDVISIKNFAFEPATVTVAPGASVTVTNRDTVTHTLTSTAGLFTTGNVPGGDTVRFTAPSKPGRYPYRCDIHQFMTGTLVVS